jgi:putative acetyltransferase
MSQPVIRAEEPSDVAAIRDVHVAAFPSDSEARLVDALRDAQRSTISLVAELDGRVVGHVAFSPVTAANGASGLGLAPVAVTPQHQKQGVGAALILAGLAAAREMGAPFVVVLGDPAYYGRFGFTAAPAQGLSDEYGGGEAFQAIELRPGGVPRNAGLVRYSPEFAMFT